MNDSRTRLSRAEFIRLIALGLPAWAIAGSMPAIAQANAADRKRRISDLIQTYDGQGIHRTATIVDNASADWLRQLANVAGGDAHLNAFSLRQVDIRAAYIEVDGRRIEVCRSSMAASPATQASSARWDQPIRQRTSRWSRSIQPASAQRDGPGRVRRERIASRNRRGHDHGDAGPDAFERGLLCQSVRSAGVTGRIRASDSVDGARRSRRTHRVRRRREPQSERSDERRRQHRGPPPGSSTARRDDAA